MSRPRLSARGPIRAVLFDLGGTLVDYGGRPWPEVERGAFEALASHLRALGYPVPAGFVDAGLARMRRAWDDVAALRVHLTFPVLFERYLGDGLVLIRPEDHAACGERLIAACRAGTTLVPGAVEVLAALRDRGIRTGLVSNTMWPASVHREDLAAFGLAPYLEVAVFSSEHGRWKPDPRIFRDALALLGVAPGEAAFVGDRYEADVVGAEAAGMIGVLFRNPLNSSPTPHHAGAIASLAEAPLLLGL